MKTLIIPLLLTLVIALSSPAQSARTNLSRIKNFYSFQHPEWPPAPGNLTTNRVIPIGGENAVVDDRGVRYSSDEAQIKRDYIVREFLRFPEMEAMLDAASSNASPSQLYNYQQTKQWLNARRGSVRQAPYSLQERGHLKSIIALGEEVRTNRNSVLQGVTVKHLDGHGDVFFQGRPESIERAAPYAWSALTNDSRADVDQALILFRKLKSPTNP